MPWYVFFFCRILYCRSSRSVSLHRPQIIYHAHGINVCMILWSLWSTRYILSKTTAAASSSPLLSRRTKSASGPDHPHFATVRVVSSSVASLSRSPAEFLLINSVFAKKVVRPKFTQKIPPKELNWTNFTKNGAELPRWANNLDRTSLQVHSRFSSPYDWSTRSELYPEAETAQPGQRGTTRMHRHRKSTHTLGNGDTTQQPARDSEGELAAAALPRRRHRRRRRCCCCCCCCCCAAAVLLLCCCFCCCCFSTRDASRSTTRLNRLFLVLCFMERTQERVTAQQQQQQ